MPWRSPTASARRSRSSSKEFPEGVTYDIPFDTTKFVREAIREVYKTLFEAGVLVLIVILVFLQDWRGVLIPATTVPVTIIGAFAALAMMGFTINMLTLFGLILAIGIVVDDAIVIVENAAHHIERGLDPRTATIKAMDEVTGPIIGITLVLMAVFVPAAFLGGITGQLYQQFALTIAATAIISAINALTLKPAQSASYLRPMRGKKNIFFRAFNWVYDRIAWVYLWIVKGLVRVSPLVMVLFFGLVAGTVWFYLQLPTGFLPTEDQGYAISLVQLPDGASLERTSERGGRGQRHPPEHAGGGQRVRHRRVLAAGQHGDLQRGHLLRRLRALRGPDDGGEEHGGDPRQHPRRVPETRIKEAFCLIFPPPAIRGLGTTAGFQLQLEDKGAGIAELANAVAQVQEDAAGQTALRAVSSTFRAGVPQLYADVDRLKAKTLDLDLNDVFGTMQAFLGSAYVNDFNKFGRTYQVRVQADERFRTSRRRTSASWRSATSAARWSRSARSSTSRRPPARRSSAGTTCTRPPTITGEAAPGYSSGDAMTLMEQMLDQRPGPGPRLRVDRDVVPGEAGQRPGGLGVRPGRPVRLPRAGGPVRELAAAGGGDLRRAAGPAGGVGRRGDPGDGQQHLHADRRRADHRPGEQERHPHRRVRPRASREGPVDPRGRRRGRRPAVPADPDDQLRLHPRRLPAGQRRGGRCLQPAGPWARRSSAACSPRRSWRSSSCRSSSSSSSGSASTSPSADARRNSPPDRALPSLGHRGRVRLGRGRAAGH